MHNYCRWKVVRKDLVIFANTFKWEKCENTNSNYKVDVNYPLSKASGLPASKCKYIKKRQLISYKIEFDAFSSGGSGESWTRVRKDIHEAFSERRSSINFICPLLKIKDKNRLASNTIHGYLALTGKLPAYFDTLKRPTGKSLKARGLNYAAIAKLLLFLAFIFKRPLLT